MKPLYFAILMFFIPLLLAGCFSQTDKIEVRDAYAYATPKTFPAAAIFMTIENKTAIDDRMVGFKTDIAGRTELHTMETVNDIMRMRQVEDYKIPSGQSHILKPIADHVMIFDIKEDLVEGQTINGIAVFEKSGEIPLTMIVKSRAEMMKHMH